MEFVLREILGIKGPTTVGQSAKAYAEAGLDFASFETAVKSCRAFYEKHREVYKMDRHELRRELERLILQKFDASGIDMKRASDYGLLNYFCEEANAEAALEVAASQVKPK